MRPRHFFVILDDVVSDSRVNFKLGAYHMDFPFLSDHRVPTVSKYLFRGIATGSEEFAPGTGAASSMAGLLKPAHAMPRESERRR